VNRGIRIYTVGVGSADGTVVRIQGRSVRTRLDEATLRQIADATGAQYYNASNEKDLRAVYENLTTQLVLRQQKTEVTAILTAIAALLSIAAAALSLVWFNRIP
jgi:Ca-activated chloride channel family protein